MPPVSSKDTQTETSEDAEGTEKTDEDKNDKKETKHWSIDRIKKEYRRFNIDLAPKVIISNYWFKNHTQLPILINFCIISASLCSRWVSWTLDFE